MAMLLVLAALACSALALPSALPMTDYSQLNHDEPTHWTKAATTPTEGGTTSTLTPGPEVTPPTTLPPPTPTVGTAENSTVNESTTSQPLILMPINDKLYLVPDQDNSTDLLSPVEVEGMTDKLLTGEGTPQTPEHVEVATPGSASSPSSPTTQVDYLSEAETAPVRVRVHEEAPGETSGQGPGYRYSMIEDIRNLFSNGGDIGETGEGVDSQVDRLLGDLHPGSWENTGSRPTPGYETLIVQSIDESNFDSDQEEEQVKKEEQKSKSMYDALVVPTLAEIGGAGGEDMYDSGPFKSWDRDSEEQERVLENVVLHGAAENQGGEVTSNRGTNSEPAGKWFILLLAGNSTIVQLRQNDFAKYLKLNLAARLSLEYDELRVNKVVVAPPRLMVNVSVVPSEMNNLDEEFDLNERLFGEEDTPLHKLAETNATLLELSGEEYHVVRFLSLRSQQPIALEETAPETSAVVSDRHADIEKIIYLAVGGACLVVIVPLVFTLCRLYLIQVPVRWPWKRDKPLFASSWAGPRHHRMPEPPSIGGPLTVIYSGTFADRGQGPHSPAILQEEPSLENPVYGMGGLQRATLTEMYDPAILESPKIKLDSKLKMLNSRPSHLLLPGTPVKRAPARHNLDVRIPKGLDNPNYST